MGNIEYIDSKASLTTRVVSGVLGMLRMKQKMLRRIRENSYPRTAAGIPPSFHKSLDIQQYKQDGRPVWKLTKKGSDPGLIFLYLHGGAYHANIIPQHWGFIRQLILATGATAIVPDYPLAPEADCLDVYQFMDRLYRQIIHDHPEKKIVFIGDSAGGGIALGFAQNLRDEERKGPGEIILISPWLDVSMSSPEIRDIEHLDPILSVGALKLAGVKYAGRLETNDFRVSPLNGNFGGLPGLSIFTGTRDILITDARRCRKKLEEAGADFNYFEYRDMFHDWAIISDLPEARDVVARICGIIERGLLRSLGGL
jgi:acetyl esterase/lipase